MISELGRFPRADVVPYHERWHAQMEQSRCDDLVEKVNELDLLSYMPDDVCRKDILAKTGAEVEALAPLLDMEVTDFALRLPRSFRVTGRQSKRLLRAISADLMPAELLQQPKRGFGVPLATWLRGELAPLMKDLTATIREWDRDGWLRPKTVNRLVRGAQQHREPRRPAVNLYCLKLWLQERH